MTNEEKLRRIEIVVERAERFGDNSSYIDEIRSVLDSPESSEITPSF